MNIVPTNSTQNVFNEEMISQMASDNPFAPGSAIDPLVNLNFSANANAANTQAANASSSAAAVSDVDSSNDSSTDSTNSTNASSGVPAPDDDSVKKKVRNDHKRRDLSHIDKRI